MTIEFNFLIPQLAFGGGGGGGGGGGKWVVIQIFSTEK